jgi:nucleotide-binding universal stress UspA family protein
MFAVHPRAPYTSGVGREADDSVVVQWIEEGGAAVREVLPDDAECVVGVGEDWAEAIDDIPWKDREVLVVGSSSIGPIARVFLGSRATKIIRHSPVPVVVVPRARAEELASTSTAAG